MNLHWATSSVSCKHPGRLPMPAAAACPGGGGSGELGGCFWALLPAPGRGGGEGTCLRNEPSPQA